MDSSAVELGPTEPRVTRSEEGYAKLASLMKQYPAVAIFRRFNSLNAQSLLHFQAELLIMQAELETLFSLEQTPDNADDILTPELIYDLRQNSQTNESDSRWRKILDMRAKLKEYNETLLLYSQISDLEYPTRHDATILRDWLARKEGGDNFLLGLESKAYAEEAVEDFLTLSKGIGEQDKVSSWITGVVIPWLHRHGLGHFKARTAKRKKVPSADIVIEYPGWTIISTVRIISTVLASVLPPLAIIGLYHITTLIARLWAMVAFSAVFALSVTMLTSARQIEVFAVTAAFAAVQVVFVGSASVGGNS